MKRIGAVVLGVAVGLSILVAPVAAVGGWSTTDDAADLNHDNLTCYSQVRDQRGQPAYTEQKRDGSCPDHTEGHFGF